MRGNFSIIRTHAKAEEPFIILHAVNETLPAIMVHTPDEKFLLKLLLWLNIIIGQTFFYIYIGDCNV